MTTATDPQSGIPPRWQEKLETYGNDHPAVLQFINLYPSENLNNSLLAEAVTITRNVDQPTTPQYFQSVDSLRDFLSHSPDEPHVRAITVRCLTKPLIRLLGTRFEMDYELWTARFQPSDREYFAGPLNEQGPRHFSHFNLACVDFYRATNGINGSLATPEAFLRNRRISHTVRLMRLIDTNPLGSSDDRMGPRMYAIRRVSGHLRRDGAAWTFLFFCDQVPEFDESRYVSDIPGQSMPCLPDWIAGSLNDETPRDHYDRLIEDGFGLVVKVLREIKSSWKLLLSDFETFLEEISDNFNDEDFIEAADFLGRRFLLNLDYFQRQLFYHQRYITFLTITPANIENSIIPVTFFADLNQEANALLVVDRRLRALRDRTTSVLDTILSLNSIKQARTAREMAQLQREDAAISFKQNESIRRLTVLNMFFLPPTLIAGIYGMNTNITNDTQFWTFLVTAFLAICVTTAVVALKVQRVPEQGDIESGKIRSCADIRGLPKNISTWLRTYRITINKEGGVFSQAKEVTFERKLV